MDEAKYTKGFNSGYALSKHNPNTFNTLMNSVSGNSDYIDGMKHGQSEFLKQQRLEQIHEVSKNRKQSRSKNQNL